MAKLFLLIILVVAGAIAAFIIFGGKEALNENSNSFTATEVVTGIASIKIKESADKKLAIAQALELWRAQAIMEADLSSGPCLSNKVIPDWVADIAHNPRQSIDDLPENQCSAYRDGTAHHFVEIDPDGNLIRAE